MKSPVNPQEIIIDSVSNTIVPQPGPNNALPPLNPFNVFQARSSLGVILTILGAVGPFIGGGVGEVIANIVGNADEIQLGAQTLVEAVNTIVTIGGMVWLWLERRAPNYRLSLKTL